MITINKIEQVLDEKGEKTLPIEKGGELENYTARAVQAFLAQNFGFTCECTVNKG